MNNNKKKKITTIVLLLAFLAIAVTGGTLAYFTDTDDATNTFVMGNVEIDLSEPNWDENNAKSIYPGKVIAKDPTVKNIGENDAYVRLQVSVPTTIMNQCAHFTDLVGAIGTGWSVTGTKTDLNNTIYIMTYSDKISYNQSTSAAFQNITVPTSLTNEYVQTHFTDKKFNIVIVAEAIQADGFANVAEAFVAYDAQMTP